MRATIMRKGSNITSERLSMGRVGMNYRKLPNKTKSTKQLKKAAREELKARKITPETNKLQVIQNNMLRMIFRYKLGDKTNMTTLRNNIKMFSINQMVCYHVILEAYNIIHHGSSEAIQKKWNQKESRKYPLRKERQNQVQVHVPVHKSCEGFTFYGARLWNQLPLEITEIKNPDSFKTAIKNYIWDHIPSY